MHSTNLLFEGFTLMLYGMGIVFVFLTLLVLITSAMSALVVKYFSSDLKSETLPVIATKPLPPESLLDENLMAVLKASVERYRQDKQN